MASPTLLIPVNFPDPDPFPTSFIGGFTSCNVLLLGVCEVPADLEPDERQRREIEANHTLYSLAHQFVRSGETAEVELVMGEDLAGTPTAVAEEQGVDALLVPNPITTLGRVLVPVRDETFADPIAEFVATLDQDVLLHTTLLHVAESEEREEEGRELLSTVENRLVDAGFPGAAIDTEIVVSDDAPFAISQAAGTHDIIIMGETEAPDFERVFGKTYESIAGQTDVPVVVVRE